MMTLGSSYDEILKEFKKDSKVKVNHAKFIARNQVANFNSISSKIRAQNLGITKAIWRTAHDERVRQCHKVRDGKEYDLSEGLYSSCDGKKLHVGTDYNCRCIAEYVIEVQDGE
jgi:SPP1 gp7 family putative phage head morphogenesis protein